MIASMHYCNYYKPYILDKNNACIKNGLYSQYQKSRKKTAYYLNKSFNNNIKEYMSEMSLNLNSLKNISNNLSESLETSFVNKNLYQDIENNLNNFTFTYNKLIGFLDKNKENNLKFNNMSENIKSFMKNNQKFLNRIGIDISKEGFLSINDNNDIKMIKRDKNNIKNFYRKVYKNLCNIMQEPMSAHMNFKDFSYYFNYYNGYNNENSFKIIEQGILLDRVV